MVCLSCTATGERVCLAAEGFGNRHCFLENIADKVRLKIKRLLHCVRQRVFIRLFAKVEPKRMEKFNIDHFVYDCRTYRLTCRNAYS